MEASFSTARSRSSILLSFDFVAHFPFLVNDSFASATHFFTSASLFPSKVIKPLLHACEYYISVHIFFISLLGYSSFSHILSLIYFSLLTLPHFTLPQFLLIQMTLFISYIYVCYFHLIRFLLKCCSSFMVVLLFM